VNVPTKFALWTQKEKEKSTGTEKPVPRKKCKK
jgi:hypothetical protein